MGFRPNRGVLRLLAELERVMIDTGRWVLAVDDIEKAFDHVILDDVLADHGRYVTDPSLLALVEVVLRGGDEEERKRGIDQGSPYSPTALNVRLHHAHDLGFHPGHHPPRYRYADNLVYLCRDVSEGRQALDESRRLLGKAGFALKGENGPPTDLRRGEEAHLLGFNLSRGNGRLGFALGCESWTKLEQRLTAAHETPHPARTAHEVLEGWIASYGPAFESLRDDTLTRVLDTAARHGFREAISREALGEAWRRAGSHWDALRERAARVSGRSP
jgi:hypothetical protein